MSKTKIVATFIQAAILVVWIAFVAILFAVMGKAVIDGVNTFGWAYFAESHPVSQLYSPEYIGKVSAGLIGLQIYSVFTLITVSLYCSIFGED